MQFVLQLAEMLVGDSVETRPSLLIRIRDADDSLAWNQFIEIYAPLIHRFACKHGLQDADAADLTQEVLRSVARSIGGLNYDPKIGRFRGWLLTVARNKLRNFFSRSGKTPRGSGDTAVKDMLDNHPSQDNSDEQFWEQEYEQRLFEWAADRIKDRFQESTWQAFWLTSVEQRSAKETADSLSITVGAVYIAKSRVVAKLRETLEQIGDR